MNKPRACDHKNERFCWENIAGADVECPGRPTDLQEMVGDHPTEIRSHVDCICEGTKIIALFPALRRPCPYTREALENKGIPEEAISVGERIHSMGHCSCQGRGWVALESFRELFDTLMVQKNSHFRLAYKGVQGEAEIYYAAGGVSSPLWMTGKGGSLGSCMVVHSLCEWVQTDFHDSITRVYALHSNKGIDISGGEEKSRKGVPEQEC